MQGNSRGGALLALLSVALLMTSFSAYAQGTLFVEGDNVGIGTETPTRKLHVRGTGGTTSLLVEEASSTEAARTILELRNNGPGYLRLSDTSADGGAGWTIQPEGPSLRLNKAGTGASEVIVRGRNDEGGLATMQVSGSISATNVTFTSSRRLKSDFSEIDGHGILNALAELPITQWAFKNEQNERRHIGPVAEDFNAAFGLTGIGDISLIDANGVALASVQALYRIVQEKDATIASLEEHNTELEKRLAALEEAVAALKD